MPVRLSNHVGHRRFRTSNSCRRLRNFAAKLRARALARPELTIMRRYLTLTSLLVLGVASGPLPIVSLNAPAGAAAQASPQSCIAIVLPSAKGAAGDATAFATSLRELFVSYL